MTFSIAMDKLHRHLLYELSNDDYVIVWVINIMPNPPSFPQPNPTDKAGFYKLSLHFLKQKRKGKNNCMVSIR